MSNESNKPSFSRGRKWTIGFNVALVTVLVLAVTVMTNYLSGHYFKRLHLSSNTRIELSPRTVGFVQSITNPVQVTLYYDKDETLFSDVSELLKEYHALNSKIRIRTVDYLRDPGSAEELRIKYNLGASTNKNWVIFDCDGHVQKVEGGTLAQYTLEQVPNPTALEYRKKPVAFNGEMLFTAALLGTVNPKPLHAYYLEGHGEHPVNDQPMGFDKFLSMVQQNYIQVAPLQLSGTNAIPEDCNLLIIAGPRDAMPTNELDRIDEYLNEGGRLLAMFNVASTNQQTGLEKILAKWGVQVGSELISDPESTTVGSDVLVWNFRNHPAVNPLTGSRLDMILPRTIHKIDSTASSNSGLDVEEIAFSGPRSHLRNAPASQPLQAWPLMVAVEQTSGKIAAQRGATRILVLGDSIFLGNYQIKIGANADFVNYAINWLVERNVMMQGVGPRPVTEFRLLISKPRMQTLQWILLGAIPGGILLFGGIIWVSRRK
ncbi:MAG: GldG family protein [Verrucomicrobiota bacterium]